jgi:hypothetical protein
MFLEVSLVPLQLLTYAITPQQVLDHHNVSVRGGIALCPPEKRLCFLKFITKKNSLETE